jgi:hypothetical protein
MSDKPDHPARFSKVVGSVAIWLLVVIAFACGGLSYFVTTDFGQTLLKTEMTAVDRTMFYFLVALTTFGGAVLTILEIVDND